MISRSVRRIAVVIGLSLMLFAMTACEEKIEQPPQGTPEPPQETVVENRYPDWAIGNFKGSVGIDMPVLMELFLTSDGKTVRIFSFMAGVFVGESGVIDISSAELRLENDSVLTIVSTDQGTGVVGNMVLTRIEGGLHVMFSSPEESLEVSGDLLATDEPAPNPVQRIEIDGKDGENAIYVDVGEERTLTYTIYPEDADPAEFIWESSYPDEIDIDKTTGQLDVQGDILDSVLITVKGTGILANIEDSCTVYICKPIESIELTCTGENRSLHIGQTLAFFSSASPSGSFSAYYEWNSSDSAVVTIDESGNAEAVGEGKATITVTARGVTSDGLEIEVIGIDSVTLSESQHEMQLGETFQLDATVDPDYGYDKSRITWTSDNPDVAKVENGLVTALAEGTANITATADGVESQACRITVLDPYVQLPVDSFHAPEWIVGEYVSDLPRQYEIQGVREPVEMTQYLSVTDNGLQNLVDCGDALYDHLAYGKSGFTITKQEANTTKWNIHYEWERSNMKTIKGEIRMSLSNDVVTMDIEDNVGFEESFEFMEKAVPEKPILSESDLYVINWCSYLSTVVEERPLPEGVSETSPDVYTLSGYEMRVSPDDVFTVDGTVCTNMMNSYYDVVIDGHDVEWHAGSIDIIPDNPVQLFSYVYDGMNLQLPVLWTS